MSRLICLLTVLVVSGGIFAGEGDYAVSKIPAPLLKNANVVYRHHHIQVELKSLTKMTKTYNFAITILNESGDQYADITEWYNKFRSIEKFEGSLYDAFGKKIRSLKRSDIRDLSGTSDISLAEDTRIKAHNFYYKVYPYTVEYEIELVINQTMIFPGWVAVPGSFCSAESSSITMSVPMDYTLRYKMFNYPGEPVITNENGKKNFTWAVKNFEAVKREYASPAWTEIVPSVSLAPSDFQIEDYKGNMKDWKELGKFQSSLNKGRNGLPEPTKTKVRELTGGLSSDKEKIITLYQYMQQNTRYVSIQLGIGGWRPFDASYVSSKGYGDCKALSNYMHSLLLEANIKSYFALIGSGSGVPDVQTDFSSIQFNHAILCVPNNGDTVWLECTSQTSAPGYMGGFTGNRHALLITEDGGVLVKTPHYGVKENLQQRIINARIDEEGTLDLSTHSVFKGIQQDDLHMIVNQLSPEKVKEYYLERGLNFGTYEILKFEYKELKKELPEMHESLALKVNNYATVSGKRLFIIPNVMSRFSEKLRSEQERKYDLNLRLAYTDEDKVEIEIPAGYALESAPKDMELRSKFGVYSSSVRLEGNKIKYARSLVHYSGRFPRTDYEELVKFYDAIYKADRNKLVMVKSE